ncbi:DUF3108 domain-containing protein [Marinilabiliaceae bacterium JC017]|nr:DUF3108 domain-containing protein [Marinilabiliaceae bacterium JC017]
MKSPINTLIISILLSGFSIISLFGQCNDSNFSFQPGEKVSYHAYYNWHFIWVNAGNVTFSVDQTRYNQKPAYQMTAYGNTYKSYDLFFKVRDSFKVVVDTLHLEPFEFNRITNEGSYTAHHHYKFDQQTRSIQTAIKKEEAPYSYNTIPWEDCSFDLLTMIYKARNIDFDEYASGDKIPINMIVDGKAYDLFIRFMGRETIKNRDGRKFKCLKFSPLLVEGTIFKSGEGMTVWVTDDKARIPIVVEAKILIGSVKAVFVNAEGLRNPIEAEILDE